MTKLDRLGGCLARIIGALLVPAALGWGAAATAQDRDLPPDAVDVLDRFLGEWKTQTTLRREGQPPSEIHTRGQGNCRRTLEGRYFEFRTSTVPAGDAELQIMTYDAQKGVYRQWLFSSDGYAHEAEGTWDPATSTLRWSGKTAGRAFVILDRFVSPGQLDWTLRRTDDSGQVVQTIEGTLIRIKAGAADSPR